MSDHKQLFLIGHTLPGNENFLLDRLKDCAEKRNKGVVVAQPSSSVLNELSADHIQQITTGNCYIAFLLKDHRIARLPFEIKKTTVEPPVPVDSKRDTITGPSTTASTNATGGTQSADSAAAAAANAAAAAANRTAKIRRIMMARPGARSSGFCRTGVIIDRNSRSRPMVPASSVPEELVVQCQVVLQGKSREVIVRELQRTNLNVNEAVNNLLSRDVDEMDDLDEGGEAYLHEELLSLLDAGLRSGEGGTASSLLDNEGLYSAGEGYEYLITRDLARRRGEEGKSKESGKDADSGQLTQEQFVFGDSLVYWGASVDNETETQIQYPPGVNKFLKITSMHSEMLALADNGRIYAWSWDDNAKPSNTPHQVNSWLFGAESDEQVVDMESCGLRTAFRTNTGKVGSFMDSSCGNKLAEVLGQKPIEIPEPISGLFCCTLYIAILTKAGNLYWRGVFPFNERRKLWEKARSKKKQVTFENSTEIVVGSEVRTKSTPIYSVGSVAVNFTEGLPLIGILYEDAWTLNETCRFRVQTPENYDISQREKSAGPREKRVSFNLAGNRKRSAPSASEGEQSGSQSTAVAGKESAWNLKDVIFIHEEAVNDTSIVKIVDGVYCGVVFKSALEKQDTKDTEATDLSKIRLMRKDDLVLVSSTFRGCRSPENFQTHFKQITLPSSVKRVISLAVDSTGFRVLCEKRSNAHLLRISCLGKLLSDHALPIHLKALCDKNSSGEVENRNLPAVENFGDDAILMLRDNCGAFQPLLRNAVGGYKELAYVGLGRIFCFGMGMRYFKQPAEVSSTTICTDQTSPDKRNKAALANKNANRLFLLAALIAPNPESTQPAIPSLMQAILFCNLDLVQYILSKLESASLEQQKSVVCEKIDGNRNIFHIAVMNAFAKTNKDQADVEATDDGKSEEAKDNSEAEATKQRYDRKWQEMLSSSVRTRSQQQAIKESLKEADQQQQKESNESGTEMAESNSTSVEEIDRKIPTSPKERQANAIGIVRELCANASVQEHFVELMQQRDVSGQTPFELAIQMRAYSAALSLWETAESVRDWSQDVVDILMSGTANEPVNDRSALFMLCANDTCSYTWTGEEHTPQDIYECKTCGLVGTLCCCSECASLCHRNHDCKLKRTSPTAYCDCWERGECKALVVGNTAKREQLLQLMLQNGKLISAINSIGENILMFLVRTVGRQLVEQESYVKRSKRPGPGQTTTMSGIRIPEHDLEPPKFARKALEMALGNWEVVSILLKMGLKNQAEEEVPILESTFHLAAHHGSTQLDKFVFTLLAWCEESSLDILLNLFVQQANKQRQADSDVHTLIQRFVRSVIRLFIMVFLLSPNAVATLLATVSENISKSGSLDSTDLSPALALSSSVLPAQGTSSGGSLRDYRAVAISGMLSLVRASIPAALGLSSSADKKDQKKNKIIAFVSKCRRVFQTLLSYSINELVGAADALIAPVRSGIVKPTGTIAANEDVIELIQQHLNGEQDFSTIVKETAGTASALDMGKDQNRANLLQRGENRQQLANELAIEERASDEEMSNDEDEEENLEGRSAASAAAFSRTRENSNTSSVRQRERTVSEASRRRRQDTNNTVMDIDEEELADEQEEHEDDEDSDHEMDEEDGEEEPYFDIHDEDEDDDDDDEVSENSDENPAAADGAQLAADVDDPTKAPNPVPTDVDLRADDSTGLETTAEQQRAAAEVEVSAVNNNNTSSGAAAAGWGRTGGWGSTAAAWGEDPRQRENERIRERERATVLRTSMAAASNAAAAAAAEAAGTGTTPTYAAVTSANPVGTEDLSGYSANNTGGQLAHSFSVLLKLIDELLLQLMFHAKWKQQLQRSKGITAMLNLDPKLLPTFMALLKEYLQPTWNWFFMIMDRTEAQLKYGNAISHQSFGGLNAAILNATEGEEQRENEAQRAKQAEQQKKLKRPSDGTKQKATAESYQESNTARTEFFSYLLSLLRASTSENGDDLPVLEYSALKNLAFVAEAYLFHINFLDLLKQLELQTLIIADADKEGGEVDRGNEHKKSLRLRKFYQRSNSISYPLLSASQEHHAFTYPAAEALPLSAKSHLLSADAGRGELFALPAPLRSKAMHHQIAFQHGVHYPTRQSLSNPPLRYDELMERLQQDSTAAENTAEPRTRVVAVQHFDDADEAREEEQMDGISAILSSQLGLTASALQRAVGRWNNTITFFTQVFHEDLIHNIGGDPTLSVLLNKTGVCSFNIRHAQFRKLMDKVKSIQTKDLVFNQMPREKYSLLQQSFRQLNQTFIRRTTASATGTPTIPLHQQMTTSSLFTPSGGEKPPPLASHKVKVTFRDEPGEGTGVARHFYAAIAEALVTVKHLPPPDSVNEDGTAKPIDPRTAAVAKASSAGPGTTPTSTTGSTTAKSGKTSSGTSSSRPRGTSAESGLPTGAAITPDTQPLFYRAAKTGFYTPITGSGSQHRLNAFRNVGRLIGICLQHVEIFPLPLARHVFKYILGRPITWYDLAFFDPSLFDSLRSLVYNEEKDEYHPSDFYEQLEMTFSLDLPAEEGGGTLELKEGGAEIPVTSDNVLEYLFLFVENRLLGTHIPCLDAIRRGVFDVVPPDSLANLTAEDLRLILCGTQDVNIQLLQNFSKFLDESSAAAEVLAKYKKTFWTVVNKFTNTEKQELCFFWTGSPNLPSTEEGFQPLPTIMIRPADDFHLPTANTCISRLYVPLYSSKKILASKLQMAIKAKNFGFV